MPFTFYVSLGFLFLYVVILLKPNMIEGTLRFLAGVLYWIFCILFLIAVYQLWASVWIMLLLILLLFMFMYVIQFLVGSLKYYLKQRRQGA